MALGVAPDEFDDVALADAVRAGDPEAAARLWTRLWPTALADARRLVGSAEGPGLAAEALIGLIADLSTGGGPRHGR